MLDKDEEIRKANGAALPKEDETDPAAIPTTQAEGDLRPWRGLFSPSSERDSLFTVEANLTTSDLQSWEPFITVNPRWSADDDE